MKLQYTPEAIADLQEMKAYIAKTLHNPKAANRITRNILDCCAHLKNHPQMGMSLAAKTGADTDLRYLVCQQHFALYRVEGDLIFIARILDGRTDYMRVLFKDMCGSVNKMYGQPTRRK